MSKILLLPGDGIGPEIVAQAVKVLHAVEKRFEVSFTLSEGLIGGAAIAVEGVPLPEKSKQLALQSDAVFLGAVGDYQYDDIDPKLRPEQGLLQIRKALGLFANLRPVKSYPALLHTSTLKPEVIEGIDLLVVRELTGGLYFGEPRGQQGDRAFDTMAYTRAEIDRIARVAFEAARQRGDADDLLARQRGDSDDLLARQRGDSDGLLARQRGDSDGLLAQQRPRKTVCSVDKANVLKTSQLWREVVTEIAEKDYPDITLTHMYVDNAAMQLVRNPKQFDVILTENTFGDILSDEASMLTGSLGMLASASLGAQGSIGLYEPSHGSAPKYAGLDKVNPIATIVSLALMLEYSFGMPQAARAVETAIDSVLSQGLRTYDIIEAGAPHQTLVGTSAMGDAIAEAVISKSTCPL
ncbi:MAG: 3-isopropylmalate dehydrogenase [Vampirovibrionales bacterium]|nr:3-isopropylmalate dehydrogenase [Vampirovibrionales bacterium]